MTLRRPTQRRQDLITAFLCLLPWMIGFLSFTLGPMVYSFILSFFEADLLTQRQFVGLSNFRNLFADELFLQSLKVTAIYALTSVPLGIVVALAVAMLLAACSLAESASTGSTEATPTETVAEESESPRLENFDPALFRRGAAERWRALRELPAQHGAA